MQKQTLGGPGGQPVHVNSRGQSRESATLKAEVLMPYTTGATWKGPHDSTTQGSRTNPVVWHVVVSWHCQTPQSSRSLSAGAAGGKTGEHGQPQGELHECLLTWKGLVYLLWWVA